MYYLLHLQHRTKLWTMSASHKISWRPYILSKTTYLIFNNIDRTKTKELIKLTEESPKDDMCKILKLPLLKCPNIEFYCWSRKNIYIKTQDLTWLKFWTNLSWQDWERQKQRDITDCRLCKVLVHRVLRRYLSEIMMIMTMIWRLMMIMM